VLCHKGYITPSQGQYQCFGATFEKDSVDETVTIEAQQKNLAQIQKVYHSQGWSQSLEEQDIIGNKAGIRATTLDHLPLVGEIMSDRWLSDYIDKNTGKFKRKNSLPVQQGQTIKSDLMGLYLFTGLGARGLTTAPLLAAHLASILFDHPSPLPVDLFKAVAPIRFKIKQMKQNKGL
jgi:tRNA 5-methylaminomethyl-2-thiouridine biosynthesis bifunctional protein